MPLDLGIEKSNAGKPNILVVGVGGGGGNAVDNMIESGLDDCTFLACNTDMQALLSSQASERLQLGPTETRGLGAGANPEVGRIAAEESREDFQTFLKDIDMVFFAAGMGGGTGTGSLPVLADVAKESGVLSMAVVTRPFRFEGRQRARAADEGIAKLEAVVDTLIVVPNQKLIGHASQQTSIKDAFRQADSVLVNGVRSVVDLILRQGIVNLDFSDVCSVVRNGGNAMMGSAEADGENRAREAAEHAVFNSLLENSSLKGAQNLLINITGGDDLGLLETDEASNFIENQVDQEANIIWGAVHDASMNGKIRVSVIATGIHIDSINANGEGGGRIAKTPQILAPLPPPIEKAQHIQTPQQEHVTRMDPDVREIVGARSIPNTTGYHQVTPQAEHLSSSSAAPHPHFAPQELAPQVQPMQEPPSQKPLSQNVLHPEVQPKTVSSAQDSLSDTEIHPHHSSVPQDSQPQNSQFQSNQPQSNPQNFHKPAGAKASESEPTESYVPNRNPHEHYTQERGSFFSRAPWSRSTDTSNAQDQKPIASFLDRFGKKTPEIENSVTYPLRAEDASDTQSGTQSDRSDDRRDENKIPDFLMQ